MVATNTYGRQVVVPLKNNSGGGVIAGDVVIVDTSSNDSFTTTTSVSTTAIVGIAQETIASAATGRVLLQGYAALVNVQASVTRGHYGGTYSVAKQATDFGASRGAGSFCQFLTGGTTPDAYVYPTDLSGGSSGLTRSVLGYQTVGGTTETATSNRWICKQITPGSSGTLIGVGFRVKNAADMMFYVNVAVYADSGSNTMGNLIAGNTAGARPSITNSSAGAGGWDLHQSSEVDRWLEIPIMASLTGSTNYWIGFQLAPDGVVLGTMPTIYYDSSGTDRRYTPGEFIGLDGATATQATDSRKYSLYGVYLS